MNKFLNEVSVRYLSSVVVNSASATSKKDQLVSPFEISMLNIEMAQYGYTFGSDVIAKLSTMTVEDANSFSSTLQKVMNEFKRTDIRSVPLFKRFPYNKEMSDADYFEKRIKGFFDNFAIDLLGKEASSCHTMLSCGHLIDQRVFDLNEFGACPICQFKVKELEEPANDLPKLEVSPTSLTILSLATSADVFGVFKNIVNAKLAYSQDFKNVIDGFFSHYGSNIKGLLPKEITNKENAAYITCKLFDVEGKKAVKYAKSYIKTQTDVLRLAVAFSGGDVSLAENTKFKLTSGQRKLIMSLLNEIKASGEDLLRNKEAWLRLAKTLHIGSYKEQYPVAFASIDRLRNDARSIETFNSKLEKMIELNKMDKKVLPMLLETVSQRGGVFARCLDLILRENLNAQNEVMDAFEKVVPSVSTNVLLSVMKFIENRNEMDKRLFIPKGQVLTLQFGSAPEKSLPQTTVNRVCEMVKTEIKSRFAEKPHFKSVYIDPRIENIVVPFAMRANSEGTLNMSRGSRIKISDDTDIVGFFINWHDGSCRVDLDLSAVFFDEDFKWTSSVSYSGYDSSKTGAYFSGDVQSGGGKYGGYEGINIDLNSYGIVENMSKGARYVAMSVISYNNVPFNKFVSLAGYQERTKLKGGDAYEASAVKTKFAVSGNGRSCVPLIFDLKTREIIWVDAHMKSNHLNFRSNIRSEAKGINDIVKAFVQMKDFKLSMKELIELHSDRFEHVDVEFDAEKDYDLVIDQDFALNLPDVVANWL